MTTKTFCRSQSAIFISDLHLDQNSEKLFLFQAFLDRIASKYEDLFILGDCIDLFITEQEDVLNSILGEILSNFAKQHRVYFMRGNHDFAVTVDYCKKYSITLLPDPCAIDIANKPVLLTHGDLLCTDDLVYMVFRRNREEIKTLFTLPPNEQRAGVYQWFKAKRIYYNSLGYISTSLTYVENTVKKYLSNWHCDDIIFGHVHHCEHKTWQASAHKIQRMLVMQDWSNNAFNFISLEQDKLNLISGKWLVDGAFELETVPPMKK